MEFKHELEKAKWMWEYNEWLWEYNKWLWEYYEWLWETMGNYSGEKNKNG